MAFVVTKPNGSWEARESRRTPDGPRSRSLATFRELTPEVIERVQERASTPVDTGDLRRRALRAGAPVAESEADRAAAALLREAYFDRRPRPALVKLLADTFGGGGPQPVSHEAERMKLWAGASGEQRAEALVELLDLGDALPKGRGAAESDFPGIGPGAPKQDPGP
jgi:hypothetical protein